IGATLTIAPLPPGQIAGNIKDTSGNPIVGAVATFTSQDKTIVKTGTTRDGSQPNQPAGSYFIDNVPVTNYTSIADGPLNSQGLPEYTEASAPDKPFDTGVTVQPNTATQPVNFTLTPILATITGRIFDNTVPPVGNDDNATGGAPTSGATVTLTDSTGKAVPGVAPVSAGADGTYTFANVPATQTPTTYTITATKAGYSTTGNTTTATVVLGSQISGKDIGLTQIPVGILTGQVTDKGTTTGVPGALVTFVSSDGTVTLTATADGNGNYTIAKVPPGTYNATATGPLNPNGHPTAASDTPVTVTVASAPPAKTANLDVIPTPPSFAGTITDSVTKAPLAGVLITITDTSTGPTKGNVVTTTHTKADGTYATGTLPPGTYSISASLVGYANGSIPSQTIYEGDALTGQNIALLPVKPGSISGQVTDKQTNGPVVGAIVTIVSTDGTQTLTSSPTDANGNYSIPASAMQTDPAGSYTGTAAGPNNANGKPEYLMSASQPVTVPSNATATAVNFVLTEIPATLTGTVTDQQTTKGIANVVLTLVDATGKTAVTTTSAPNGTYAFPKVPAGQSPTAYTLNAAPPAGYFPGSVPLPSGISLGDALTLNIPLNEQGTVTGLVTDSSTGQPLSNVTLTLTDTTTGGTVTTTPAQVVTANNTSTGPDGLPSNYVLTFVLTPG
ncbi:MAG: carboxypeptidase regulatory-like domain-containing protein, partial [Actinomycetota bacterium]|nr:carboxypeptidase regulatory-like domain-containing protein [Actinomycetota bacterium]